MVAQTDGQTRNRNAIEATDLAVTYADGTRAVRGIDLAVAEGECFGFLGPNGAGKTTVIKALVTLLGTTRGSVRINGFDPHDSPRAVRASIGYMAQETSVDETLTTRENLAFACDLYGVSRGERADRIADVLELVGLEADADRQVGTFSGGMAKRLDVATALVHEPPIVFLDEPTTGLDPRSRNRLWEHVRAINDRGVTVFLTTQYLAEADALCDRIAVLQDGSIVATDTPATLKAAIGGDVLEVTLADPNDERRAEARRIARDVGFDPSAVEPTDDGISVTADRARSAAPDLLVALSEAGLAVTGFEVHSPTLDDVFLSLTGEDAGEEPTQASQAAAVTPGGDR
ncbi:ABC-type multidrug transport system, ATPase component [Halorhabdus sp. SVX81]|uniref:ABC transporter ATP-binding protein n=1 Tax=Halorhabdus sp. SVX81 TaxID=2978283 RepID=UPI0023DBBB0E|nr:ATP-binding cassette domain-containing protein [Halorhabdus sp. SVX81]WEL16830.1 ABC-type multidrug transport system, ATPase component [Halorhabdus sp. SVX81]